MHANKLSAELTNQPTTNPDTVQLTYLYTDSVFVLILNVGYLRLDLTG